MASIGIHEQGSLLIHDHCTVTSSSGVTHQVETNGLYFVLCLTIGYRLLTTELPPCPRPGTPHNDPRPSPPTQVVTPPAPTCTSRSHTVKLAFLTSIILASEAASWLTLLTLNRNSNDFTRLAKRLLNDQRRRKTEVSQFTEEEATSLIELIEPTVRIALCFV